MKAHRVHRLLRLINLLRSGREFQAEELAQATGIARRTVFRDLRLLNSAGITCRYESGTNSYCMSESQLLPPVHLDVHEALATLLITRRFLTRQVHPLYQKALDAALKIESQLPQTLLEHCGRLIDGISVRWQPVSNGEAATDVFLSLQRALSQGVLVRARYDSVYDKKEVELVLEPLRLVFVSRAWYLIAFSQLHDSVRTFKIERMLSVEVTNEPSPERAFDESRYFGAAWSMIPEGRLHRIRLRFTKEVATSVEEVLWHQSQSTQRLADGRLLFEAEVDGLGEIAAWILGYGEHVEVLAPTELRRMVVDKAAKLIAAQDAIEAVHAAGKS